MSSSQARKRPPRRDAEIDEAIEESFPASDPPSFSRMSRAGAPSRGRLVKSPGAAAAKPDDTPLSNQGRNSK
jgi:hypothetical protein